MAKVCLIITFLIIAGGLAVLIAWLADHMKSPTFSIDQASINGYNFTTNNYLNASFNIAFKSHNRDPKYTIKYEVIVVQVYHNEFMLAYDNSGLGLFTQHHGADINFTAQAVAQNLLISNADVAGNIRSETKSGQLNLDVWVRAAVRFEVKGWKHRHYTLKIICSPLVMNLTSGLSFEGIKCSVSRF